ncbi:MAG TPA: hypothetical protein VFE62_01145 [Gemmataceae bacterium]|nr:hypothetical protein [Gemmataceae bacterium]
MRHLLVLSVGCALCVFANRASAQPAAEKTEKRVTELITPSSTVRSSVLDSKPMTWKSPAAIDKFVAPQQPVNAPPVRLQSPTLKAVKPRSAAASPPLLSYREQAKGPKDIELPTEPLIQLPSLDANTPAPLPILAKPAKDRASLGDPAFETSLEAALKSVTPTRDRPVPFTPFNLPDPFENLRYGQLRNPPEESATPPVIPLTKPIPK